MRFHSYSFLVELEHYEMLLMKHCFPWNLYLELWHASFALLHICPDNYTWVCCCESVITVTPGWSSSMFSKSLTCSQFSPQRADMSEADDVPTDRCMFNHKESSMSPFSGITPFTAVLKSTRGNSPMGSWWGGKYWLVWKCGVAWWRLMLLEVRTFSFETSRLASSDVQGSI